MRIRTKEDRKEAARRIRDLGPRIVVIKGGHDEGMPGAVKLRITKETGDQLRRRVRRKSCLSPKVRMAKQEPPAITGSLMRDAPHDQE